MGKRPSTTDPYSKLFKKDIFKESDALDGTEDSNPVKKILSILNSDQAPEKQMREQWSKLRKFYISGEGGILPDHFHSIHINPNELDFSSPGSYPFLILPTGDRGSAIHSFGDWLKIKLLSAESPSPMMSKLLPRFVRFASDTLGTKRSDFREFWDLISRDLSQELELKGGELKEYDKTVQDISKSIESETRIIGFSAFAILSIIDEILMELSRRRKAKLAERIDELLPPLLELLEIERENDPSSNDPGHLQSALSFADHYFDFNKLSSVLPESASEHLDDNRFDRISEVIRSLQSGKDLMNHNATIIIDEDLFPGREWEADFNGLDIHIVKKGEICQFAEEYFESHIKLFSDVIKALRIARLEKSDRYRQEIHDEVFGAFSWRLFTHEEMDLAAPVVVLADTQTLIHDELAMFSRILGSGIPIKIMGINGAGETVIHPLTMAMSHRDTYVAQLNLLDPVIFYDKLRDGFGNYTPAFIQTPVEGLLTTKQLLIYMSALLESRAMPVFSYNGKKGSAWGSRFDIMHNPFPEELWPVYEYHLSGEDQETISSAFTYADYLSLDSRFANDYKVVPIDCWTEDLLPLGNYIITSEEDRYGKLPYIWLVNELGQLHKTVVSLRIVHLCEDVQDFWQYLQDNGGVHNFHAEEALKNQEKTLREEFDSRVSKLKEEFNQQLEKVARESSEEAMDNLTSALLDLDPDTLGMVGIVKSESAEPKGSSEESDLEEPATEKETKKEEEIVKISQDPWIESELCTYCNECVDINNRMFKYDDNKLAFIADPNAGTFAQLVEAAEKCPVHIIHPGQPLNPDEPDLPELIDRAAKYN